MWKYHITVVFSSSDVYRLYLAFQRLPLYVFGAVSLYGAFVVDAVVSLAKALSSVKPSLRRNGTRVRAALQVHAGMG